MQQPWSLREDDFLIEASDILETRAIALELKRTNEEVRQRADLLGVPLKSQTSRLEWCDVCATYRSQVDEDGKCPICILREQLDGLVDANAEAWSHLTPKQQRAYTDMESVRAAKVFDKRPQIADTGGMTRDEKQVAEDEHALLVEKWEAARLIREKNVMKQRTKRIRDKFN